LKKPVFPEMEIFPRPSLCPTCDLPFQSPLAFAQGHFFLKLTLCYPPHVFDNPVLPGTHNHYFHAPPMIKRFHLLEFGFFPPNLAFASILMVARI